MWPSMIRANHARSNPPPDLAHDHQAGCSAAGISLGSTCHLPELAIASAWVRSLTDKGTAIYWPGTCTWIVPDKGGTPELTLSAIEGALSRSIANWRWNSARHSGLPTSAPSGVTQ